ncbi:MAG: sugar phosphate isomerase/epimerase [Clostridia bacterium]|nr:sugar phosphate isomerase/epimerase [Clostridia bacterium]
MYNFELSAFGDEINANITEQMNVLERNGVKFIELRGINGVNISDWKPKEFKEIINQMKSRGFGVSSLGSPIGKIGINDDFEGHLDKFKNTLDLAAVANTAYIRMFSFYMPQNECEKYREKVLERWNKFVEAAKGYNVTLLHENEHGIYGESAKNCLDLIKTLNSDKVKAVFDPANFTIDGHDTIEAFELLKDYSVYFHIKDAKKAERRVVPSGEGDGNLKYLIDSLKERDFNGFLSLEPHLATGDISVGGDALFEIALNALRKLI